VATALLVAGSTLHDLLDTSVCICQLVLKCHSKCQAGCITVGG